MYKEIKANFNWIDSEIASIQCPYCKEELIINISADNDECRCGKKFILRQRSWVEEIL